MNNASSLLVNYQRLYARVRREWHGAITDALGEFDERNSTRSRRTRSSLGPRSRGERSSCHQKKRSDKWRGSNYEDQDTIGSNQSTLSSIGVELTDSHIKRAFVGQPDGKVDMKIPDEINRKDSYNFGKELHREVSILV